MKDCQHIVLTIKCWGHTVHRCKKFIAANILQMKSNPKKKGNNKVVKNADKMSGKQVELINTNDLTGKTNAHTTDCNHS